MGATLPGDTREDHLLFGAEIGEYIDELFKKGSRLVTIYHMSGPQHTIRPEDRQVNIEIVEWFSGQRISCCTSWSWEPRGLVQSNHCENKVGGYG